MLAFSLRHAVQVAKSYRVAAVTEERHSPHPTVFFVKPHCDLDQGVARAQYKRVHISIAMPDGSACLKKHNSKHSTIQPQSLQINSTLAFQTHHQLVRETGKPIALCIPWNVCVSWSMKYAAVIPNTRFRPQALTANNRDRKNWCENSER